MKDEMSIKINTRALERLEDAMRRAGYPRLTRKALTEYAMNRLARSIIAKLDDEEGKIRRFREKHAKQEKMDL